MKEILLTQGRVAIVDDEDFEELSKRGWHYNGRYATGVSSRKLGKRKTIYMHVKIIGKVAGLEVDHINGNPLDNRRGNLRLVTKEQNARNTIPREKTSSKYKGVYWFNSQRKWRARICCEGKEHSLGMYESERDAAWVYNVWAESMFGEHARLNVLD